LAEVLRQYDASLVHQEGLVSCVLVREDHRQQWSSILEQHGFTETKQAPLNIDLLTQYLHEE
jgi:hypothetical protein